MDGYAKKSGAKREGRSKFVDDIDEIVSLADVVPAFEPDSSRVASTFVNQFRFERCAN